MKSIDYCWIDNNIALEQVCYQAKQTKVIALDTEFVRTRTYHAQLGLIQLYDGQQVSLIDPLSITDFSPFIQLLAEKSVLKVLHSGSEDLEVFQHYFQQLPEPMADTQIMAGFAGIGTSLGFAKLVQHYLGLELDKGASRTDWLSRPLSDEQRQYACADVYYLLPAYQQLAQALSKTAWEKAADETCLALCEKIRQPINVDKAYKKIANAWQLNQAELAILQLLAKWRIAEAQKRNLALNFIVKEQSLLKIAQKQPKHTQALLDFMHPNEVRIHGKKLILLVEQGRVLPPEKYPPLISRSMEEPDYKKQLKALQRKMEEICPEDLALELLASKRQLHELIEWYRGGQTETRLPALLDGWRKPFGEQLKACLSMS